MVITASCGAWLHDGRCQDKEENNTHRENFSMIISSTTATHARNNNRLTY